MQFISPVAQWLFDGMKKFPKINLVLSKLKYLCLENSKIPDKTMSPFIKSKQINKYGNQVSINCSVLKLFPFDFSQLQLSKDWLQFILTLFLSKKNSKVPKLAVPKIQQTKMLVTCQSFYDLFLFDGLVWQYSTNQNQYNKGRVKIMATYLQQ